MHESLRIARVALLGGIAWLGACGPEVGPEAPGDSSSSTSPAADERSASEAGEDSDSDTEDADDPISCDIESRAEVSCRRSIECLEGATERGDEVVQTNCEPEDLQPQACDPAGVLGRCYDPSAELWTFTRVEDGFGDPLVELEQACWTSGGVFCEGAPGAQPGEVDTCLEWCGPYDVSTVGSDCAVGSFCVARCIELSHGRGPGCVECIMDQLVFMEGGCNEDECLCPILVFPRPDDEPCRSLCTEGS